MPPLEVRPGTLLRPLGGAWAAFSSASGETHLLNNEAAALLEALLERPRTVAEVAQLLAAEAGVTSSSIVHLLEDAAHEFHSAGLVCHATSR